MPTDPLFVTELSEMFFYSQFDSFETCLSLVQSVANMPPSGEALKILARDLGNRVYTKYSVRQKHENQMLEKLGNIYNAYTDLLAKDTKVEKPSCSRCPPICLLFF